MTGWVAFLRGVNLGKRQMQMAELRACCESIGLEGVKTILASGNVRFDSPLGGRELRQRLEQALADRFTYPVQVILRARSELERMVAAAPFAAVDPAADVALHVLFADRPLQPPPDPTGLPSHIEVPRIDPEEIYFIAHRLPNGRYTEGLDQLGKLLSKDVVVTMRNWNTVLKALA